MGQVEGKVAIVTGGASGIGAACAATLAREGAKVVITDLDDAGSRSVVDRIAGAGGEAICLHQDVSLEESWPGVIEATAQRFGRLDVMVANAGIGILCKAIEMSLADWRRQTAVNLDGVFLSVKYAVPAMRRAGGGSIIITSSVAGLRGSAGLAGYCATKGGVRLFAKAVAMECASEGDGIRINTVHPGGHRDADLDEDRGVCRTQRPDRCQRGGQRGAARPGRASAGHREWRLVPGLGCVQLHDRRRAGDRWRHDRRRYPPLELNMAMQPIRLIVDGNRRRAYRHRRRRRWSSSNPAIERPILPPLKHPEVVRPKFP